MRDYHSSGSRLRAFPPENLSDIFVRQTMESVTANAAVKQEPGQCKTCHHLALAAMKGGIEACDLRDTGPTLTKHTHGCQVVMLMQRRQRLQCFKPRQDVIVDQDTFCK